MESAWTTSLVDYNDRSRRHFEFQVPDNRSSQWSNKSTALVTCEHLNHEIKGGFTTTTGIFQACSASILEIKGMHVIFQKKCKNRAKKGKILKIWAKMYKI